MSIVDYEPGHADHEVRRQHLQAMLMQPATNRLLDELELREGQTVLDIGCGPGDVCLLAAARVGSRGRVVGVDLSPKVIAAARHRAQIAGHDNVEFHVGSEADLASVPDADLVIGRLVLIHQSSPVEFIRALSSKVRSGGAMAFHEHAGMAPPRSRPPLRLFDEVLMTITNCFQSALQSPYAALEMSDLFRRAGLAAPKMGSSYPVINSADSPVFEWCGLCLRMFSEIGALKHSPHDPDTLGDQLRSEFSGLNAQAFGMLELHGWARL